MIDHPCLACGACCASLRVSFHWSETCEESFHVPAELTTKISPHLVAMSGTNQENPRCEALIGVVGKGVSCAIYSRRSSSCRDFIASFEDGTRNERCDAARAKKGLLPLTTASWKKAHRPEGCEPVSM